VTICRGGKAPSELLDKEFMTILNHTKRFTVWKNKRAFFTSANEKAMPGRNPADIMNIAETA